MKLKKWFGITALAATAVIGLAACGSGNKNTDAKTVKIGVMTKSDSEEKRWSKIQELLKKDNIKLQFTEFTDYSQPNKAVADGEVDINAFQHYYFLNNWNKENKQNLVAAAETLKLAGFTFSYFTSASAGK